ncbi:carboxymuconolactone decarboxylase family protein [Stakelama sediminis]|uniref:Alkylhydroperoxidase family enzyme n=1 Tax=Stakelama sediminis TaxID=463200 RepID=A0A840YZZ7_9SPHN|nr:carboxymuconolactone decarboxylase family protein [Stakelama sediminis]MBB5719062.1 alkylhydroperoxidase family enzyme [Stakelama sediminis]
MRLPLLPPDQLSDEQRPLYADMKAGIGEKFDDFIAIRDDGALMGPWNPWLRWPKMGGAIWDLTKAMSMAATLPDPARQVAILVTGAHFDAAYELYAHVEVAERDGMNDKRLSELCANIKPDDLSDEEGVAYDVAYALVNGGTLPRPCYDLAVDTFGQDGTAELIYLVGLYCLVSMTLNGFNVPVPEKQ